jgi:hypothetical protein
MELDELVASRFNTLKEAMQYCLLRLCIQVVWR